MGAINIKHTGSGSDIALSSDGTSLLLNGSAIGGGGGSDPDLYRDNASSAVTPTASGTNAVAIGSGAVASGALSFAFGSSGSNAAIASGSQSISMGSYSRAYGSTSIGVGYGAEASSGASGGVALGQNARSAGNYAVGLANSYASGSNSFAAGITNNSSSYGASGISSIAGGYLNKASSSDSLCWGGDSNICHNSQSAIVGGQLNNCSGGYSFITGGYNNRILGTYSRAGGKDADTGDNLGKDAYASGKFSSRGDCQTAKRILMRSTTDATATVLTAQGNAPNTTNQVILPNNSCYGFTGTVIARENSAQTNDFAVWEIKGGAVRAANAASTTLGTYNINKISESSGASNWSIALSADTTNGAVAITVTGEASHSIRWVATVNTTEVTY
jgi:hypothetical protein